MPLREHVKEAGGPPIDQLMRSIRDVAVFAWALVGINGNLASYSHGQPGGESQPPDGLPIWDPNAPKTSYLGPEPTFSRRRGDAFLDKHSAKPISSNSPFYKPGPAPRGGQGHTHALSRFDNMNSRHSNTPLWAGSLSNTSFSEPPAYSHVQQQPHYPIARYPNGGTLGPQSVDEVWTEASTSHNPPNENGNPIPRTQAYGFGEVPQNSRHLWK
jgi:hypothetical protein